MVTTGKLLFSTAIESEVGTHFKHTLNIGKQYYTLLLHIAIK